MRPLNKGPWPKNAKGDRITVSDYKQWRSTLIDRIGYYCVYCNMPLSHSLEVEHVTPKNPPAGVAPGSLLDWDNMLLACGPCNNAKGNSPVNLDQLYFPESHNTLLPFDHKQDQVNPKHAIVIPDTNLKAQQKLKAEATIKLMNLDHVDLRPDVVDIRSIKRKDAMVMAQQSYSLFQETKTNDPHNLIRIAQYLATVAKGYGFFGSWFRIFKDEPVMIVELLNNNLIPGTSQACFDAVRNYKLIDRNPTNTEDPI